MNLDAINRVLPVIGLSTEVMGSLVAADGTALPLVVPPPGWDLPAVPLDRAVRFALAYVGSSPAELEEKAKTAVPALLGGLPIEQRPLLRDVDGFGALEVCASVATTSDAMVAVAGPGARDLAILLGRVAEAIADVPLIYSADFGDGHRSLRGLPPDEPIPSAMTEFMTGFWLDYDIGEGEDRMDEWLAQIRPVCAEIEAVVGVPVFRFADPDDDLTDDEGHRWLALDCLCHLAPDDPVLRYLMEVVGAPDVAAFRHALRSPAIYSPAFRLSHSFSEPYVGQVPAFVVAEHIVAARSRRVGIACWNGGRAARVAEGWARTLLNANLVLAVKEREHGARITAAAEKAGAKCLVGRWPDLYQTQRFLADVSDLILVHDETLYFGWDDDHETPYAALELAHAALEAGIKVRLTTSCWANRGEDAEVIRRACALRGVPAAARDRWKVPTPRQIEAWGGWPGRR